ncbi:MAG: hypothetical protein CL758_01635 [Chloroflexi bacterium]|nr:hypothetical protein [Chloroflexota bacterium]|tara:strand:- start:20547 stop:21815 length:1269 start_codon:yes stop_codon:yes gene_type:complete
MNPNKQNSNSNQIYYGWRIVGFASLALTLISASSFQSIGTYIYILEKKFGWSRTKLSAPFSLSRIQGAVFGPIEGWLIDKIGSRIMILIGFTIVAIGILMFSQIQYLWQFYFSYIIITIGAGFGGWLAIMSLVNNWFIAKRTFALATSMTGVYIGGFLIYPLSWSLEKYGFETTTTIVAIIIFCFIPIASFVKNKPEDINLTPYNTKSNNLNSFNQENENPDFTVGQALRTQTFWILAFVHMFSTISLVTMQVHLVPLLTDMNMSLTDSALVIATFTTTAIPAQLLAGYLGDKLPKPQVAMVFYILQGISLTILTIGNNLSDASNYKIPSAFIFAIFWGIAVGGRVPLLTAIRGEYFGRKAFGSIMGISMLPNNLSMLVSPILTAYIFEKTGTYNIPLIFFAILAYIGAIGILMVKKPIIKT